MSTVMKPLYAEVDQYEAALDWIEEHAEEIEAAGGVLPPGLEALMEQVEGHISEKAARIGLVIRNLTSSAKAAEEEVKHFQARRHTLERQVDCLKHYLTDQLNRIGVTKIDSARCPVRLQINSSPSVELVDPVKAQAFYVQPPPEFSARLALDAVRARIAAQLDAKKPFAALFVELGIKVTRNTHVRVG